MPTFEQSNLILGLATLGIQIAALLLLLVFFFRNNAEVAPLAFFLKRIGLPLGLVLTLGAVGITLYHSVILGIIPCSLCYVQRIFLYPQAILFIVALWKKDHSVADYSIALSLFGGGVALYQHLLQMGAVSTAPCTVGGADCAARIFFEFEYITYPLMAFSLFAFLIVLMLFMRRST